MPLELLTRYSNLLLTVYRDAQEKTVAEFQDSVLSALKAALPFDSSMWGHGVMNPSGLDIHSIHLHNSSTAMLLAYDKVKHQDDAAFMVTQQPTTTMAFSTQTFFDKPDRSEIRQFATEFGHENYLISCDINPITKFTQWISLYRKDARQICTQLETQLFANLAPHLMQALAINRKLHLDKLLGDTVREKWSVAIADPRGYYYHVDPRFLELLELDWTSKNPDVLPPALLKSLLSSQSQVNGHQVVVRCSVEHGLLYLKARESVPADLLSPKELLIARLLANGLTKKEVAEKLGRSLETVRSHVRSAFVKLDIQSTVALTQHLALAE